MGQLLDVLYLLNAWNVSVFIVVSFVLLLIFVWRSSIAYSCTDEMNLRFRSRAGGNQEGEIAPRILLDQSHSCTLSVIIPAFKEATRVPQSLKGTLLAAVDHLQGHERSNTQFSWEIIVVDDGSPDGTSDSVILWTNHLPCADRIRVVRLPHNMGKGAAVKTGMFVHATPAPACNAAASLCLCTVTRELRRLRARGQYLLMADADGAAPISEWVKLRAHADQNQVVIGRRQSTQRKFSRLVLSLGFRLLIRLVSTHSLLQQRFSCFPQNSLSYPHSVFANSLSGLWHSVSRHTVRLQAIHPRQCPSSFQQHSH